jgi:hypothetical protein
LNHEAPDDLTSSRLSFRDAKIMDNLIAGKTFAEIASELCISRGAFETVYDNMAKKMGIGDHKSAPALVARYAFLKKRELGTSLISTSECEHHWMIGEPNGPVSKGVCKRCGTQKEFRNSVDLEYGHALRISTKKPF